MRHTSLTRLLFDTQMDLLGPGLMEIDSGNRTYLLFTKSTVFVLVHIGDCIALVFD